MADDGREQWRYEAPAGIASTPVARDAVFVVLGWSAGTHGIAQRLVRIDDGSETWTTDPRDRFLQLLHITGETAYLGTSDDELGFEGEKLFAIQTSDGGQRWSVEAGDATDATVSDDTLYAVEGGRRTTAFAVSDGRERWHRDMPPASAMPRVFGDVLYLESEQENESGNYPVVAVTIESKVIAVTSRPNGWLTTALLVEEATGSLPTKEPEKTRYLVYRAAGAANRMDKCI